MGLVIGLLTLLLVLNSLLLILLVLVQLPKKEAGAGLAFGAGTTDALFGSGSGTALSRMTKYGCGLFLILSLTISALYTHTAKVGRQDVLRELERKASTAPSAAAPALTNAPTPVIQTSVSNVALPALPAAATNAAAVPATTNPPVAPGR